MKDPITICRTTGEPISVKEMRFRDGKRNEILEKLQMQLGKTRNQVLELFRFYSKKNKK